MTPMANRKQSGDAQRHIRTHKGSLEYLLPGSGFVEVVAPRKIQSVYRMASSTVDVTQWASATCDPGPRSASRLANRDMDVFSLPPSDYGPLLAAKEREKFGRSR